jgi:hypothetical protein
MQLDEQSATEDPFPSEPTSSTMDEVGEPSPAMMGGAGWPLNAAAGPLLPAGTTDPFFLGILGFLFQSRSLRAIYADLQALALPGLAAFGIDAEIVSLPETPDGLAALLQSLPQSGGVPLYRFAGEPFQKEDQNEDAEPAGEPDNDAASHLAEQDLGRTLERAGLFIEARPDGVVWQDATGQAHTDTPPDLRAAFPRAVRLTRGTPRATRRGSLVAAVQRVVIYSLGFPDRVLTGEDADGDRRELAAQFFREAAGKQRDPISLRWRQAGDLLADGRVTAALDRLYDAAIRTLNLPDPVFEILTAAPGASLTNMQRRELIYLARAGNQELKVLAAHRLANDQWSVSVRQTLDQLATAPDPLVRAAARTALSAGNADKRR